MEIELQPNVQPSLPPSSTTAQESAEVAQNNANSFSQETTTSVITQFSDRAVNLSTTAETRRSSTVDEPEQAEEMVREFQNNANANSAAALQAQSGRANPDIIESLLG